MKYYCEICDAEITQEEWEENDCLCDECYCDHAKLEAELDERT